MCSKYVGIFFTRSCIHAHRPPPLRLESGRFPPSFLFVAGQVSALLAILVQASSPANMADSKHCKLCDTDKKDEEMQDNNRCRDCNPLRQRISKLAADPATGKFFEDLGPEERTKFYQDNKADSEIVMVDRGFMVDLPWINHAEKAINHVLWLIGVLGGWLIVGLIMHPHSEILCGAALPGAFF